MLQDFLKTSYENLVIVGSYVLDECSGDQDVMVNEINAAAADILLSVMDSPQEDTFLLGAKAKIRARLWYSLGDSYQNAEGKMSFMLWFRQLLHKGRFKSVIHHYEENNGKDS